MRINAFFKNRLKAKLHHSRMSWGAVNAATGSVFLRVGIWSIDEYDDGSSWALIRTPEWDSSFGQKERAAQIELLMSGNPGYIVPVENRGGQSNAIVDENILFRIGALEVDGDDLFAELAEEIPTAEVLARINEIDRTAIDIDEITQKVSSATTRKAQIETRIGQGKFREDVLRLWDYQCAVTGCRTVCSIRASHILPWNEATNAERLDPNNGLPLVATIDAIFDAGLISFNRNGSIMIADALPITEQERLSIHSDMSIGKLSAKMERYMSQHRSRFFSEPNWLMIEAIASSSTSNQVLG